MNKYKKYIDSVDYEFIPYNNSKKFPIMQQGGQVRQPIPGTQAQYNAYKDSLDLYNDSRNRTNLALQNANYITNRYNSNRYFWQAPLRVTNELYPTNYAVESGSSSDGDFNYENYWADTDRSNYEQIRNIANRTGYLPRVRRITTTSGNDNTDVHDHVHFYDWQQPVQPIIYQPQDEDFQKVIQDGNNRAGMNFKLKTKQKQNIENIQLRQLEQLQIQPINQELQKIPFSNYFTRPRQSQESGQGKMDYFDKKTGKLLVTYKTGGKVSDWEIIFD